MPKKELLHYLDVPDDIENWDEAVDLLNSLRQPDWAELASEFDTDKLEAVVKTATISMWVLARGVDAGLSETEAATEAAMATMQAIFGAGFREGMYYARRKDN